MKQEYEISLVGRLVEVRYPDGHGGILPRIPRGRVHASIPTPSGHLTLWLEILDEGSAHSLHWQRAQVGDVLMVSTSGEFGDAVIRIINEPVDKIDQLARAMTLLRRAIDDVSDARRMVDNAMRGI